MDPILFFKIFFTVVLFCFGLIIGSFLNVCIYRIPEKRTVVKGHSMCMSCGHNLGPLDLVPLFSWLFLRGKCRYCKSPIASRYALIEGLTAVVFGILAWLSRDSFYIPYYTKEFPWGMMYLFVLLALSAVIIVSMMIWKDKQQISRRFALVVSMMSIVRLILITTRSTNALGSFLLIAGAAACAAVLVLAFALFCSGTKRTFRERFLAIPKGDALSTYFSKEKNGLFALDLLFISLCAAIGFPSAIPACIFYTFVRIINNRKSVTPYMGIALAAGAFLGLVAFPLWIF